MKEKKEDYGIRYKWWEIILIIVVIKSVASYMLRNSDLSDETMDYILFGITAVCGGLILHQLYRALSKISLKDKLPKNRSKLCLLLCLFGMGIMGLFPPLRFPSSEFQYTFIFNLDGHDIDYLQLLVQWFTTALIGAGFYIMFKK
jgi:H+/Cl- antiporter ClcA